MSSDLPGLSALQLVGDQPTFLILCEIATGRLRPIELERRLALLGHTVVSRRLGRLVRAGVLLRHTTAAVPRQVSYELSRQGRRLAAMVLVAALWEARVPAARTSMIDLSLLLRAATPLATPPSDLSGAFALTVADRGRSSRDFVVSLDRGKATLVAEDRARSALAARASATTLDWCDSFADGRPRRVNVTGDSAIVHAAIGAIHQGLFAQPLD